jgi:hypothetical protein
MSTAIWRLWELQLERTNRRRFRDPVKCLNAAFPVERFKNLGISASRANVATALAELELELELASWVPWRLVGETTRKGK